LLNLNIGSGECLQEVSTIRQKEKSSAVT